MLYITNGDKIVSEWPLAESEGELLASVIKAMYLPVD